MSISERRPRVIVQLASSSAPESVAESLASALDHGRLLRVSRRGRALIELAVDADAAAVARALGDDPRVDYAEPDVIDTAFHG